MNKSPQYWAQLDRRYLAGQTTLEEEQELRRYWQKQQDCAEQQLAHYFHDLSLDRVQLDWSPPSLPTPEADKRFVLPQVAASPDPPGFPSSEIGGSPRPETSYRHILPRLAAAAAVLLLLWLVIPNDRQPIAPANQGFPIAETIDWSQYEITDPKEARALLRQSIRQAAEPIRQAKRSSRPMPSFGLFNSSN